jgi:hypothetical protein
MDLVMAFPAIDAIWLFGSRADGTATAESDWDLIAFSQDRLTADLVEQARLFYEERFDLFIAHGDEFRRPWPRKKDGVIKRGTFSGWQWRLQGDNVATYSASADKPNRVSGTKPAIRIWTRTGGWLSKTPGTVEE